MAVVTTIDSTVISITFTRTVAFGVGKPGGKRPLGRHRRRWEDNIRWDLREIGWEGVDWMHLAQ
jgi:hypothetical protein